MSTTPWSEPIVTSSEAEMEKEKITSEGSTLSSNQDLNQIMKTLQLVMTDIQNLNVNNFKNLEKMDEINKRLQQVELVSTNSNRRQVRKQQTIYVPGSERKGVSFSENIAMELEEPEENWWFATDNEVSPNSNQSKTVPTQLETGPDNVVEIADERQKPRFSWKPAVPIEISEKIERVPLSGLIDKTQLHAYTRVVRSTNKPRRKLRFL